jgi:hypothetical protein
MVMVNGINQIFYSDDYFGPVKTSASDGYQIKTGYFTDIKLHYGEGLYYEFIFRDFR